MASLVVSKIISIIITLFGKLISLLIPFGIARLAPKLPYISKYYKPHNVLSVLETIQGFAGGVVLSGGLIHLLPESHEIITEALEQKNHQHSVSKVPSLLHEHHHHGFPWAFLCATVTMLFIFTTEKILQSTVQHDHDHEDDPERQPINRKQEHHHEHDHLIGVDQLQKGDMKAKIMGAIVLWLSLVLHCIVEGMGLGALLDETRFWGVFVAIVSHEFIASFSMGIILNERFKSFWAAMFFGISFCVSTPLGIAIGMGFSTITFESFDFVTGIVLACAAGAFLHVGLFEILAETDTKNKVIMYVKFIFCFIGFAIMTALANFV